MQRFYYLLIVSARMSETAHTRDHTCVRVRGIKFSSFHHVDLGRSTQDVRLHSNTFTCEAFSLVHGGRYCSTEVGSWPQWNHMSILGKNHGTIHENNTRAPGRALGAHWEVASEVKVAC